jgi:hypothetical protein
MSDNPDTVIIDNGFNGEAGWSDNSPKGGRAVFRRMLSEGAATVPLFLGQTFVRSLRDVGYNNSISAVCEHVDNAVQWGARNVRVYFNQRGGRGDVKIDVVVLDDGAGMSPETLRVAMSFGGSTVYDRRDGIGRFGVGMKTAALSMGPRLEVYSWQDRSGFYYAELDVDEIGDESRNLVEIAAPEFRERLPGEVVDILTSRMDYPRNAQDQDLLATSDAELSAVLGEHGTIVYIPGCDRITAKDSKNLYELAAREMSRVYRKAIAAGVRLFVNNKPLELFDPTYALEQSRHTQIPELADMPKRSRLVQTWHVDIPVEEGSKVKGTASVRLYLLPDQWHGLSGAVQRQKLRIFDNHQVSFVRNGREVHIGPVAELNMKRHAVTHWMSLQIDFDGELDEAFGVAMTKQGVRPKSYALKEIDAVINKEVSAARKKVQETMSRNRLAKEEAKEAEAERRAREADAYQRQPLPETEEEKAELESNLRALAVTLKRSGETDEQAFERISQSLFIVHLAYDEYRPFYTADYQYGRVIVTVNTAHPFYAKLYRPLEELSGEGKEDEDGGGCGDGELLVALQMLLFSLARTQSEMTHGQGRDEYRDLFRKLQTTWSENLETQLNR